MHEPMKSVGRRPRLSDIYGVIGRAWKALFSISMSMSLYTYHYRAYDLCSADQAQNLAVRIVEIFLPRRKNLQS